MNVAIVDDHPLFRSGLAHFLRRQPGISVIWEAGSAREAFERMLQSPADVLLMDVALQGLDDGLVATVRLVEEHPQLKVVVISGSPEQQVAAAALDAGASSFLRKDVTPDLIVTCLRRVWSQASSSVRPGSVRHPQRLASAPAPLTVKQALTAREQEVMVHIKLFRTNGEIAERLGVSRSTVNKHVHQILSKLGARSRAQAAAMFGMDPGLGS